MRNNKGFTLIELILVVAILALFAGGVIQGISYITYADTKRCANRIDAAIDQVRLDAMSRAVKPCLYLYEYDGSYYMKIVDSAAISPILDDKGTRLANSQIKIAYRTTSMADVDPDTLITGGTFMKLDFVKSTGGIAEYNGTYYNRILVKDNDGTVKYTITMVQGTGKHFIE